MAKSALISSAESEEIDCLLKDRFAATEEVLEIWTKLKESGT